VVPPDQSVVSAWVALFTPISVAILTTIQLIAAVRNKRQVEESNRKLDANNRKLEAVHVLVNSDHGLALRQVAVALERIAGMTNADKDEANAVDARKLSDDHDRKQREVDQSREAEKEALT